nr:hypothetical protein [Tanacetum cinerariifolium]
MKIKTIDPTLDLLKDLDVLLVIFVRSSLVKRVVGYERDGDGRCVKVVCVKSVIMALEMIFGCGWIVEVSSIFADKSDKGFFVRVDQERDCKENTDIFSQGNIVTNSRVTLSWREIVSLIVLVKLASYT